MSWLVLKHSAKGTTWSDHKYIAIKNGRYIYPEQKKIEQLQNEKDNLEVDRDDEKRQNMLRAIDAAVKVMNEKYLGRDPKSLKPIKTDLVDEYGEPVYMEADEYLDYLSKNMDEYESAIADREQQIASLKEQLDKKIERANKMAR